MFGGLSVRVIIVIVGLATSFCSGWYVNQLAWEKKHAAELFSLSEKTKAIQNTIEVSYVIERNKKDEEIRNLNKRLNDALSGLRDRPSLNANPTAEPSLATKGCYPTELFREYAEYIIKESVRADEVRIAYIELYNDYQNIRNALGQ